MRRSSRHPDGEDQEPSLFDLPLDLPDRDRLPPEPPEPQEMRDEREVPPPARPRPTRLEPPPLERTERPDRAQPRRPQPTPVAAAPAPVAPAAPAAETATADRAGLGSRFAAGLADLLVHAAVAAVALGGSRLLGADPTLDEWPALLVFLLSFSFLYTILPLAFWGQTLGMTWAGLAARNRDGEPLTFDQTARRWLGGLLCTATLGLPLLVSVRGRTLTDLLSGSATYRVA